MSKRLLEQFVKGLEKDDHDGEVKMLITYVHDLPDGKENGEFLALDLGNICYVMHLKLNSNFFNRWK